MNDDDLLPEKASPLAAVSAIDGTAAPKVDQTSTWSEGQGLPTASERDFRMLADCIPQLAWMADRDGSIF